MARKFSEDLEIKMDSHQNKIVNKEHILDAIDEIKTEEEFKDIAVAADAVTKKCRWDKIYLLCPHGKFVDDHTRYMACSGKEERHELFEILCNNIKASGNWDKVTILDGGYYNNFKRIVEDVKGLIEYGKLD